jgi:biopolymer transport protein ExbB/TolQ
VSTLVSFAIVIGAFAELVIAILLAAAAWYLFDILRRARDITEKVRREGEEIIEELEEAREDPDESALAKGAGLAAEVVADLLTRPKKKRKKST